MRSLCSNPGADSETWSALLGHTLKTLMVAVTLIVVAVPEGLPMAVTLSLAYSMSRMLKTNNLVRKMHACETMGATTVICTDKTGTLTRNQMQVYQADFSGILPMRCFYEGIAVNSTAQLDLSGENPQVIGNPTEGHCSSGSAAEGMDYRRLRSGVEMIEELPFSTERKYMATVVKSAGGRRIIYVKGLRRLCSPCAAIEPVSLPDEIEARLFEYQNMAMRTLGFAYQELGPGDRTIEGGRIVSGRLTFLGIAAISDPVRPDVPAAVKGCCRCGIRIKIVTGDTPGTAREIGRQIGLCGTILRIADRNIITGTEFAAPQRCRIAAARGGHQDNSPCAPYGQEAARGVVAGSRRSGGRHR